MANKCFSLLNRAFEILIFFLFMAIVIVGGLQVFNRFVLNRSLSWSEELMIYAHIWMVFLAIPVAYSRGSHIGMNLFVKRLPPKSQTVMAIAIDLMWLLLASAIVFYTTVVMGVASNQTSPALGLRMDRAYLSLVVGATYLALVALRKVAASVFRLRSTEIVGGPTC